LLRRCAPRNDIPGRHMSLRARLAERGNLPPIVAPLAKGRTRWQCPFLARGSCGKAPPPSPSCPARNERKYLTRERATRKRDVAQPPPAVKTAYDRLTSFDEQLRQWPAPWWHGLGVLGSPIWVPKRDASRLGGAPNAEFRVGDPGALSGLAVGTSPSLPLLRVAGEREPIRRLAVPGLGGFFQPVIHRHELAPALQRRHDLFF
jgi:hypothetical protein